MKQYAAVMSTPIGKLGIIMHHAQVTTLNFVADELPEYTETIAMPIVAELNAYFSNPEHHFQLHVETAGTAFQQRVWRALTEIPGGTTLTYGALAKKLNSSPRAVGQACRRNPVPVIVPCHRVTGATKLGGYAGDVDGKLFAIKQWLLQHEKNCTSRLS